MQISDDKFDSLANESEQKYIIEYSYAIPESSTWGVLTYGDAPGGIGGGVPGFLWFPAKEDMFDFIGRLLPYYPPGPASADLTKICETTTHIVSQWSDGEITMESALSQLNIALKRHSQIDWCGQFEELLSGDTEIAKSVRSQHNSVNEEGEEDDRVITADEQQEFIEILQQYGV
tara:strand:- start:217 stop:741 length:525 start_codon:yes stop_codon:yes gene_type:complete